MIKRITKKLCMGVLLCGIIGGAAYFTALITNLTVYARELPTDCDQLKVNSGGGPYIYSNNPEHIYIDDIKDDKNNIKGRYTVKTELTPGIQYMAEFSHVNWTTKNIKLGILLKNTSTSKKANISIDKRIFRAFNVNGGIDQYRVPAELEKEFQTMDEEDNNFVLQPGESVNIFEKDATANNISNGYEGVGKATFSASIRDVVCSIIYADSKETNLKAITTPTSAQTHETGNAKIFEPWSTTNILDDSLKFVTYTVSPSNKNKFLLWGFKHDNENYLKLPLNTGEYEDLKGTAYYVDNRKKGQPVGKDDKKYSQSEAILSGNYGILYSITLKNSAGKVLYIKPLDSSAAPQYFPICLNGAWSIEKGIAGTLEDPSIKPPVQPQPIRLKLPNKKTNTIKIILPANMNGNVKFGITDN